MTATTATLTADQRASKVAKITALLQKTEANGCTADEATAARAMADRLCDQYGISASECQPQTRRRATSSSDFFTRVFNLCNQCGGIDGSHNPGCSTQMSPEQRQEQARAKYRRNGVHIDEGFHADCQCRSCRTQYRATNSTGARQESTYDYMADEPSRGRGTTGGTGRKNTSHKNCDHEATSSARARCRKNRGY